MMRLPRPMPIIVVLSVLRRPIRSARIPRISDPTGRAKNPTAKIANVDISGTRLPPGLAGKNCVEKYTAGIE